MPDPTDKFNLALCPYNYLDPSRYFIISGHGVSFFEDKIVKKFVNIDEFVFQKKNY